MPGLYSRYIKPIHAIGDAIAITVSSLAAYYLVKGEVAGFFSITSLVLLLFSTIAWFSCTTLLNTYKFSRVTRIINVVITALKITLLYILLIEATLNIFNINIYSRQFLLFHYLFLALFVLTWRIVVITALRYYRRKGYNYRKVIIVGYSKAAKDLKRFIKKHPEHGYRFLGCFDDKQIIGHEIVGKVADVERFVLEHQIDEIYCCPYELQAEQVAQLIGFVDNHLVRMKFLPQLGSFPYRNLKVDFYDMLPVLIFRSIPLDDAINKVTKRAFDIVFSLFVIIFILSWLLPILAILIKIDSKGPIFFMQERSGIDNKVFKCWKLRTMFVNSDANSKQAQRNDSRITAVGNMLRKTSLDELPQFFNVLLGQMSVVGPRPHMLKHTQEYAIAVDKFMVRHFVKPGITGLSQVRGFRGDTSESYQIRGRVKLDIFYLENWSFILDLKIIFLTVLNIIKGDNKAF